MVHLIPSRTDYSAKEVAELVFSEVYKLHGLPKSIVSDRDVLFTSTFWDELHKLIGTRLQMSSAYHPESDGATERANCMITQMLRQCIKPNQKDWVLRLPAIEFAINSALSESTGFAPFFLNSGRMPRSLIWDSNQPSQYPGVRVFAQRMKSAVMQAHDSIIAAHVKQVHNANRKRQHAPFASGDFVYISMKNISLPKGLARKLAPKFIGPYLITEDFKNNSYWVKLPSNLKARGIHDVFHASLLRIQIPNDDRLFPGCLDSQVLESEDQELEFEWAVEKISSHASSGNDLIFEVLWRSGDSSWLPKNQVEHLTALKEYCDAMGMKNVLELPIGLGKPPHDDPQIFSGFIGFEATNLNFKEWDYIHIGEWEMVYMPRHLSSLARSCPAVFSYLATLYLDMPAARSNTDNPSNPTPDIFASPLAAETVDPSLLNVAPGAAATTQPPPALNAPTIRSHPVSFYGHPLVLPAPMHNTTGIFLKDDVVYLADAGGNTMSISVPEMKMCLRFHSLVAKTKFNNDVPGINALVEPASYRIVTNYLNNDPLIFDKLVIIHETGAVEYPPYKDRVCPYSLRFDYPDPRLIRDTVEIFGKFGNSKELAENTMWLTFMEGTKKAAQPKTPYTRGHQQKKPSCNKRQDQDEDVRMG
jgi:hypothetical protein